MLVLTWKLPLFKDELNQAGTDLEASPLPGSHSVTCWQAAGGEKSSTILPRCEPCELQ